MNGALSNLVKYKLSLAKAGGLELDDLQGPFQPKTFYDKNLIALRTNVRIIPLGLYEKLNHFLLFTTNSHKILPVISMQFSNTICFFIGFIRLEMHSIIWASKLIYNLHRNSWLIMKSSLLFIFFPPDMHYSLLAINRLVSCPLEGIRIIPGEAVPKTRLRGGALSDQHRHLVQHQPLSVLPRNLQGLQHRKRYPLGWDLGCDNFQNEPHT